MFHSLPSLDDGVSSGAVLGVLEHKMLSGIHLLRTCRFSCGTSGVACHGTTMLEAVPQ